MTFDPAEFRKVLGHFATGVAVVTTIHGDEPHGMTVNSFTSVSLDPPLVLFCADKRANTHGVLKRSGLFAVNLLGEAQRPISDLFAGRGTDAERLAFLATTPRAEGTGSPIIPGALGFIDCRVKAEHDAGDHIIYIGDVLGSRRGEPGAPLLYYRGTYQGLDEAWRWPDRYAAKERATRFDDLVDFFERMEAEGPYAALLDALVELAAPSREDRCLDVGCGTGRLVRQAAARCREAKGVDVSAPMVERARARAKALGLENVAFEEARAEALPFAAGAFDQVIAANLLMGLADPVAALKEAARVLRPGGRVALLEPTLEMTHGAMTALLKRQESGPFASRALLTWADAAEGMRRWDEARLAEDLRAGGFTPLAQTRKLDGLALLTLAERG